MNAASWLQRIEARGESQQRYGHGDAPARAIVKADARFSAALQFRH